MNTKGVKMIEDYDRCLLEATHKVAVELSSVFGIEFGAYVNQENKIFLVSDKFNVLNHVENWHALDALRKDYERDAKEGGYI
jgi:hypothetical protein